MKRPLTKEELIYKATYAMAKDQDYEKFMYSDEMYGHEDEIDEVWEYVEECEEIGTIAFKEKYKEFKMSPIF
jgi:hypothetical protein